MISGRLLDVKLRTSQDIEKEEGISGTFIESFSRDKASKPGIAHRIAGSKP